MTVRTHSAKQLLESIAAHRDMSVATLDAPEPIDRAMRLVHIGRRDALNLVLEILERDLPDVESDAVEDFKDNREPRFDAEPTTWNETVAPSGWDTGRAA